MTSALTLGDEQRTGGGCASAKVRRLALRGEGGSLVSAAGNERAGRRMRLVDTSPRPEGLCKQWTV